MLHYLPMFPSQFPCCEALIDAPDAAKNLPPVPQNYDETPSNAEYYNPRYQQEEQGEPAPRSRVPLIVLAQQQQGYNGAMESEPSTPRIMRPTLSTITERTERTEPMPYRPQLLSPNTPQPATSSLTSSYGEIIGKFD